MAAGNLPAMPADPGQVRRSRRDRLILMVAAAFSLLIFSSTYAAVTGRRQAPTLGSVIFLLCLEAASLAIFWYVLSDHPAGWQGLRLDGGWIQLPVSLGLAVAGWLAFRIVYVAAASVEFLLAGHYPASAPPVTVLDLGLNAWTLALVLMNPFFEEWIARGFVIREVEALTGKVWVAVAASVLLQAAYHTYQGPVLTVAVAANFLVWSLFYARSRRILPVILAHLYLDLFALLARAYLR